MRGNQRGFTRIIPVFMGISAVVVCCFPIFVLLFELSFPTILMMFELTPFVPMMDKLSLDSTFLNALVQSTKYRNRDWFYYVVAI